jgi:cytochrome c oxidase subunit 2
MRLRSLIGLASPLLLAACNPIQSTLATAGEHADRIETLGWAMFIGGGLIFLLVFCLTAMALLVPQHRRRWLADRRVIYAGGIAFPVVVLSALLVYGLLVARALVIDEQNPALTIEVVGERWWWRAHYLDEAGNVVFATANEIRMPTGQPVRFVLRSQDVIHSFWVPSLAGKLDMIPGRINSYTFSAEKPGVYRGQCAEYCGAQHALMAFFAVAMEPDEFETWVAEQSAPAEEPRIPYLAEGQALFLAQGCGACHTVRGSPADGSLGPDLTHVGSRLSIGAGILPNNVGTLAGWISSVQHLKPEALMPSFGNLQGEELRAIAAYLESLE